MAAYLSHPILQHILVQVRREAAGLEDCRDRYWGLIFLENGHILHPVHPIRRLARRTETYPNLETFLFLITTRRFGSVGAPEGREKVPDYIFLQNKKSQICVSGGRLWMDKYRIFPQIF